MKTLLIAVCATALALAIFGTGFAVGGYARFLGNQHGVSVVNETTIEAANRMIQINQINGGDTNGLLRSLNTSLDGDILILDMFLSDSLDLTTETRRAAYGVPAKIADIREKTPVDGTSREVDAKVARILQDARQKRITIHNQNTHGTR